MKKIATLVAVLFTFPFIASAQWTAGSPTGTYYLTSGNAGIGTMTPSEKLQVNGSIRVTGSTQSNVASSGILDHYSGYTRLGSFGTDNSTYGGFLFLNLTANGTNVTSLAISPNGNVGIGTTSPQNTLHVNGGFSSTNGGPISSATPSINLYYDSTNDKSVIYSFQPTVAWKPLLFGASSFSFVSYGTNQGLFQASNGNVGIGTTTPDTKLAVNGTIHSKEVKVDLLGWPDYVFKPTYQLPKLSEVKSYIDQNQHLPDMPSEAEVKKDGINLGEMVKLQTKKIEELTLYLIEQNKEIKLQNIINQQLELRLKKLETPLNH